MKDVGSQGLRYHALRAIFQFRSSIASWWGFAAAGAFAALVVQGFFVDLARPGTDSVRFLVAAALCAVLAARVVARLKQSGGLGPQSGETPLEGRVVRAARDVEVGLLFVVTTHALIQLAGGLRSPLYPLVYALACFVVAADGMVVGGILIAASLGIEALVIHTVEPVGTRLWLIHAVFAVLFAGVGALFLRTEALRLRRKFRSKLDEEIERFHVEAAEFRLIGASLGSDGDRTKQLEKLWSGSVEAIHQSLFYILEMLKNSLNLQSCVLLWLDDSGTRLKIREVVSDSDMLTEGSSASRHGLVGGVLKTRSTLNLCPVRQPASAFPYYRGPEQVGAFLGIPVLEGGFVRGVICADRRVPVPFDDMDVTLMDRAADQILRTVQSEQLFCGVERSKYEQERFFHASEMLNQAWKLEQVMKSAFRAARQIVDFQAGAITLYDVAERRHRVAAVDGEVPEGIVDLTFTDATSSLVTMVVKNRHYLPVGGRFRANQPVFNKKHRFKGMQSMFVMPLIAGDRAVGTVVLACSDPGVFTPNRREMLRVIGHQVAVSIQNALMLKQLEEMATTDGLTGLMNHRTFQDRMSEMLARAKRSGMPLSFVLTDIDHFKKVNDTYGHPIGDVVLKGVSQVLATSVRTIDVVARYGGEEFTLVLEGTDGQGAVQLAERIREEVAKLEFDSEQGPFHCTMSFGVASYPDHGTRKEQIIELGDQALYRAKETGRNRVKFYGDM
ncbi:MAG: diguanylate cyclase [Deltaproteobacteria bacterium]|nr:diguanylate cyclase [Deltaproteobacteria bacterium]